MLGGQLGDRGVRLVERVAEEDGPLKLLGPDTESILSEEGDQSPAGGVVAVALGDIHEPDRIIEAHGSFCSGAGGKRNLAGRGHRGLLEGRAELFLHVSPGNGERWRTSIVAGGHFVLPDDILGVDPFAAGHEHGTKRADADVLRAS